MKKLAAVLVGALLLGGCSSVPRAFDGYVHAECDPTTAEQVTNCRVTQKPIPTVTVTVTPEPTATSTPEPAYRTDFGQPQHEDGKTYTYPNLLDFGPTTVPPAAKPAPRKGVDLVAHWYNDFGLDATARSANSSKGWYGWYDWRWNFPTNTGDCTTTVCYDPSRHPLQGFYKGDDPNVLGWQAYWLAEAGGVNAVALTQSNGFKSAGWSDPASSSYWVYQLFHRVPNFKALNYVLSLKPGGTPAEIEAQNDDLVNVYKTYPGAYTYTEGGKRYAVASMWDMENVRGVYDAYNGQTKTVAYLKGLGAKFKAAGFDGVMVLARRSGLLASSPDPTLKDAGVVVVSSEYESAYSTASGGYSGQYGNYAANVKFPAEPHRVLNVVTAAQTQFPHPSGWTLGGSTPSLFGQVLQKAVDATVRNGQRRMVTIYNVSEWAEGGPGLIPQKRDGFGYLDAAGSVRVN